MIKPLHILALGLAPLLLGGCELGFKESSQNGYRGTAMAQIDLASQNAMESEVPDPPYALPEAGGQTAGEVYENVQVLADVPVEEFDYLMAAITQWVVPETVDDPARAGCNYCHNPANLASDEIYTKTVARRMIQMTQNINLGWTDHVRQTGVTCWTCHRGNAVPEYVWTDETPENASSIVGNRHGQNRPVAASAYSSLPVNYFSQYLSGEDSEIRVQSASMHPSDNRTTTMGAEHTYGLMMHLSESLGVNCTYCHASQGFRDWSQSSPARTNAWFGIRMVREVNSGYITPLTNVFPANRLGPQGDPYKVNCTTCHQGQARPLGGVAMVADYPSLRWTQPEANAESDAGEAEDEASEDEAPEEMASAQ